MKHYNVDNRADYAEMFESVPEFASQKLPRGISVVLVGDKIRPAKEGEIPFGVVSSYPIMLGNSGGADLGKSWGGKYLKDEFGNFIMEEVEIWVLDKQEDLNAKAKEAQSSLEIEKAKKRPNKTIVRDLEEKLNAANGEFVNARKEIINSGGLKRYRLSGYVSSGNVPEGAKIRKKIMPKLNPDYDENTPYVSRLDRPEWNMVGLIGKLKILKGQPVASHWVKLKEISENVDEYLIR